MQTTTTRQIALKGYPHGEPTENDFEVREAPLAAPAEGEVLYRVIYLSLDPYMRGRMSPAKSYADPVPIGGVMVGATVGQVVASRDERFAPGDFVLGYGGWQTFAQESGSKLIKLDPKKAPISYSLGVLGMPGATAYCALLDIGKPKAGETLVVSAASGAVGSVAGQIGKILGLRVVGIAGGKKKCTYVVEELGFDACVDRNEGDLSAALLAATPDGIDVYYDNTAGPILEAVLKLINLHARIALVGLISQYNATSKPSGPDLRPLLTKRARIEGYLYMDSTNRLADFLRDVSGWLHDGKIKYKEDVVEGLERAPRAFIGLLRGENFGKLVVKVADDPSRKA